MGETKYLQIQIVAKKKDEQGETLRPLTIKVACEDPKIQFDPNQEITLPSGQKRNLKILIPKAHQTKSIELQIKNTENEVIDKRTFTINEPSIYGSDRLF